MKDLAKASKQGTILRIKVNGKVFGSGGFGSDGPEYTMTIIWMVTATIFIFLLWFIYRKWQELKWALPPSFQEQLYKEEDETDTKTVASEHSTPSEFLGRNDSSDSAEMRAPSGSPERSSSSATPTRTTSPDSPERSTAPDTPTRSPSFDSSVHSVDSSKSLSKFLAPNPNEIPDEGFGESVASTEPPKHNRMMKLYNFIRRNKQGQYSTHESSQY